MPEWGWILVTGTVVIGLVGVVWRMLQQHIASLEATIADLRSALDKSESAWRQWTRDKERFDRDFRHDEYHTAITNINAKLWPLDTRVDDLIKRIDRIESKMNGHGKGG